MPVGMSSAPVGENSNIGFGNFHTNGPEGPTSFHFVPSEQFIHQIDVGGECLCGPVVSWVTLEDGQVRPQVAHQPLDPGFYDEWAIRDPAA